MGIVLIEMFPTWILWMVDVFGPHRTYALLLSFGFALMMTGGFLLLQLGIGLILKVINLLPTKSD